MNGANLIAFAGTIAYVVWAVVLLIVTRGDAHGQVSADDVAEEAVPR